MILYREESTAMGVIEITAQIFGIFGLAFSVLSFQEKNNKRFQIMQGVAGLMFFMNFILIGAISAALFNLTNLVRGTFFQKKEPELWKLIAVSALYTLCFIFSICLIIGNSLQIVLSTLTYITLMIMTFLMWKGNGKHIRYGQLFASSPSWIIHNIFNFSLGGILCEIFSMTSVIVSFIRFGKDGFEK